MQIGSLPVCTINVFGNNIENFYVGSLEKVALNSLFQQFHLNNFFMILMIEKAVGEIVADDCETLLNDLQLVVIKPKSISKLHFNTDCKGKVICFTEDFFSLRYNDNMLNQFAFLEKETQLVFSFSEENFNLLYSILSFAENEFLSCKKDMHKALRSYLNIFLIEIERSYKPLKKSIYPGFAKEKAYKFQNLVNSNYKLFKFPSYYAGQLNISTNYLNKISKQYFGMSSGELIRNHLILESKRILHYTNLSVSEVAFELGFDHISYFVSFFKKHTGETPEQFRKKELL